MRTDSLNISDEAREAARRVIVSRYGGDFYPTKPNFYRTKAKGAQEAHEAIRPTDPARTPEDVRPYLNPQQFNVYRLIWQRFVASQMAQAVFDVTQVDILGRPTQGDTAYTFRASGSVIRFPGFLEVYREGRDAGDADDEIDKDALPALTANEPVDLVSLVPEQHWTQPPPRYTEASLVKALEERGIGRPSTYASTIATILNRNYVTKDEKVLVPSELGTIVTDVLVKNFPDIVDYGFTSQMEERLDEVAEGKTAWVPLLAPVLRTIRRERQEGGGGHQRREGRADRRNLRRLRQADGDPRLAVRAVPLVLRLPGVQEHPPARRLRRTAAVRESPGRADRRHLPDLRQANGRQDGALWALHRLRRLPDLQDEQEDRGDDRHPLPRVRHRRTRAAQDAQGQPRSSGAAIATRTATTPRIPTRARSHPHPSRCSRISPGAVTATSNVEAIFRRVPPHCSFALPPA